MTDDRREVLAAYAPLRVADVRDGMDWMMMHRTGSMVPAIRPLWHTRACGSARCARYVPYEGNVPSLDPDAYRATVGRCIEYIAAGDIFQVNLSQRLTVPRALVVALLDVLPLVVLALAACEADLDFGEAPPEVEAQGQEGEATLGDFGADAEDLASVEEELAGALGV